MAISRKVYSSADSEDVKRTLQLTTDQPPPVPATAKSPSTAAPCTVVDMPGGGLLVSFRITEDVAFRLRRRAGTMDMARYLWDNILHRSVVDSVY